MHFEQTISVIINDQDKMNSPSPFSTIIHSLRRRRMESITFWNNFSNKKSQSCFKHFAKIPKQKNVVLTTFLHPLLQLLLSDFTRVSKMTDSYHYNLKDNYPEPPCQELQKQFKHWLNNIMDFRFFSSVQPSDKIFFKSKITLAYHSFVTKNYLTWLHV